jgi:signal transduction histidine kinase
MTGSDMFGSRGSLRRRVTLLMILAGVVVAVMLVGALVSFDNLSTNRTRLADQYDPALVASSELLAAVVDQETGVRGFVLSGDRSFLEPFTIGQGREQQLTEELAGLLEGDRDSLEALAAFERASLAWREEAGSRLSVLEPDQVDDGQLLAGKALFDEVRARHGELDGIVEENRAKARSDLNAAASWLRAWLIGMTAMLIVVLVGIAIELRRSVLRPLTSAVEQAKLVAEGDLDRRIQVSGSSEFVELGDATDAMRRRIVGQLREVDESRAELAASNRELEQFAYVASHDLQEPLRKVTAFSQMLQQRYGGQLDERADSYINFAVDGATRMQELINDLLTLSRVGRTSLADEEVVLDDVVARAVSNVSESIDAAGATVTVGPMPVVRGERALLIGLFQNLISNAVKFRDPERTCRVSVTSRGGNGEAYEFDVTDNGIGIEPQYAERVFVVFQRLHTREQYDGTGIGLSIARKIVEHHGGRLWIATDHTGPGTTFRFTLPEPIRTEPASELDPSDPNAEPDDNTDEPGVAEHVQ